MVKDITTSQLDFLALEEVSDRAAETISGGAVATITSPVLETEADLADPLALPLLLSEFIEEFTGLTPPAGMFPALPEIEAPAVGEVLGNGLASGGVAETLSGFIA